MRDCLINDAAALRPPLTHNPQIVGRAASVRKALSRTILRCFADGRVATRLGHARLRRGRRRQRQHRIDRLRPRARRAASSRHPGHATAARSARAPSGDRRRRLPAPAAGTRDRPAGRPSPRNRSGAPAGRTGRTSFRAWEACRAGWRRRSRPRWCRASRAAAGPRKSRVSFCPVRVAARAASSCSACFLLLTFNAGRIASGATRSVIVMGRSEVN